jgi:hypothetical protein
LDFGIPSLHTIVETKIIKAGVSPKKIQEELMIDLVGYFSGAGASYRYIVPFTHNQANVPIDSATTTIC